LCLFEGHTREALAGIKSVLHPKPLLKRLKELGGRQMRLGRQEDAHEFLRHFLDACHRSALRPASIRNGEVPLPVQHTTMVHQLFGGYLRSQVLCLECNHESSTFDPFLDLSLEVKNASTLEKALEGFTKVEKLCGRNQYRCKRCQRLVDATKRFFIHTTPPVLTFQLKRFDYSQGFRGKIAKNVVFGTSVDLARFTSRPEVEAKYRLYAVIVHSGQSARSGHYFAFARHASGTWYHFDDDVVRPVPEQHVLRQQAYLLFYETASPSSIAPRTESAAAVPSDVASSAAAVPKPVPYVNGHATTNGKTINVKHVVEGVNGRSPAAGQPKTVSASEVLPDSGAKTAVGAPPATVGTSDAQQATALLQEHGEVATLETPAKRKRSGLDRLHLLQRLVAKRRKRLASADSAVAAEPGGAAAAAHRTPKAAAAGVGEDEATEAEIEDKVVAAAAPHKKSKGKKQDVGERVELAGSYKTQFGLAQVDRWDDDVAGMDEEAEAKFEKAQRILQPEVQRRDQLDVDYDVGKKKHKPKKEKATFEGKSAFDKEEQRRKQKAAGGGQGGGRPKGKGKGKGKGKDKGKGKGKSKGKGKGSKGKKGGFH